MVLLLTQVKKKWIVKTNEKWWSAIAHSSALSVKDAFEAAGFTNVDNFYQGIFYLLKNSGAIKSDVQEAAKSLNISAYTLPKLSGTRFVSHRVRALARMLNMWPAIISAFENTLVTRKHKSKTRAKIQGLLNDFRLYVLILTCVYLDILEKLSPASIIFESNDTILIDITSTIKRSQLELKEL